MCKTRSLLSCLCGLLMVMLMAWTLTPLWGQTVPEIDRQVEALLARMTLEEKVGQMTQVTIQAVSSQQESSSSSHRLDPARLRAALVEHHVGSILNVGDAAFTLDHWHEVITAIQDVATRETRLQIPVIYGIDAVHGANYTREATLFPQNLALAATWNPELVEQAARITAFEVRASGIPWNFSPVLDLGRQPLWSRFFETFGEDVFLARAMAAAAVKGYEGGNVASPERVAACLKHFVGYSFPLTGKDRTPAWIPERMLREYFVPPFQAGLEAGAHSVMANSSGINWVPVHSDPAILTDLLRKELGFNGVLVSDWEDVNRLHSVYRVAASRKEAVRMAVTAGIDMSMVPYDWGFADDLVELVRAGEIPESRIDESVRRILRLKFELALFDNPYPRPEMKSRVGSAEFQAVSLEAARQAVTLLKNENGILPLSQNTRVLVTGPTARSFPAIFGSWTYTWQGMDQGMYPTDRLVDLVQALESKLGEDQVEFVQGTGMAEEIDIPAAVEAAREAGVVILCLGEDPATEKPGDIDSLLLPEAQIRLARAIQATETPAVLVLIEARPRIIRTIADGADAILTAYQTGPFGFQAVAEILLGDVNPSGRLPFTYPRYSGSIVPYDHRYSELQDRNFGTNAFQPQFEFGHGLSYTRFSYSDLKLSGTSLKSGDTMEVSVQVTNAGNREGQEVVQLYLSDLYASVEPAVKRLKGFRKISLGPGESQTVKFELTDNEFSFIGRDDRPVVEPGEFQVRIGGLSETFLLEQ